MLHLFSYRRLISSLNCKNVKNTVENKTKYINQLFRFLQKRKKKSIQKVLYNRSPYVAKMGFLFLRRII